MNTQPTTMRETLEQIVRRFAPRDRAGAPLTPATRLIEDFGIDSPRMIDIVLEIEDRLGVAIEDEVAQRVRTFGEMLALIGERSAAAEA